MSIEEIYAVFKSCSGRLTTDSRAICGGEMFLALKGENFDGNAFALQALEKGAAVAVVNRDAGLPDGEHLIKVDDTFKTLQELAVWHREHVLGDSRLPVIGLTGTNGKTTTKELINAVLSTKFRVTATKGNLNNDIGVPLSLLSISEDTQIAVIEMGASHPDDILKLVQVSRPDYGLITNVGKAHLLGFGSFEGVKKAKGELYNWLGSHPGSVIFLNEDDPDLVKMASTQPCHCFGYGLGASQAETLPSSSENPFLSLKVRGRIIKTRLVGSYNAANVLAALAIGEYFGVEAEDAARAIEGYVPSNNRSQMARTERNTLIIDAYNANPSSMAASLENFASIQAPLKYALLGDMRELGEDSHAEHVQVIRKIADMLMTCRLQGAFLVGDEFGGALAEFMERNLTLASMVCPRIWHCDSSEELAAFLRDNPLEGATVLIKGSRGIMMEKTIKEL